MRPKFSVLIIMFFFFFSLTSIAWAKEPIYSLNKVVQEGQSVENVFLYGEDGVISGTVNDEVVVINGNLTITKTAHIRDRVFLVGGQLTQEPGATVGKGIFHINFANQNLNSLLLGVGAFALIEILKLTLAIYVFLASLVFLVALRTRVNRAKTALETSTVKTGLLGLFGFIGTGLILLAFSITIWGIPIAATLGILIFILLPIGLAALSLITGELLLKNFSWGQKPFYQVLVGSLFLVALFNFPVLGVLWGILIVIFSFGALAFSLLPEKVNTGT